MVAKMHRMHLPKVGEGVIYVPGGVPFEADDVPEYPVGSYMRVGNKEFIYAISGGITNTDLGVKNEKVQMIGIHDLVTGCLAGEDTIVVTVGAVEGQAGNGAVAANELAGGEIVIYPHSQNSFTRGVISNTAVAAGGGSMTVVMDAPTPVNLTVSASAELMASPYSAVKNSTSEWALVMGIATVKAASGKGLWLQVSGPSWIAPQTEIGAAALDFECVFRHDGSIELRDPTTKLQQQLAGFVIATAKGTGQGAPFVMLQIAH